jgi:hypothetical protein
MFERGPQSAMVIILERHKPKRLQYAVVEATHRAEDFGHPMDRTRLRLEGDFDEVTLAQRLRQTKQSASGGNGLEFSFCAAAVFEANRSQNGIS